MKISRILAIITVLSGFTLAACSSDDAAKVEENKPVEELYTGAANALDAEDYEEATRLFEEVERQHPYSQWATRAELMAAYSSYKDMRYDEAILALDRFIELHPGNKDIDYALYLKALANFKEDLGPLTALAKQDLADRDAKAARESFENFKELITRFPESRYVNDSRERMIYLVEALARHEVHVARYYLLRGAYLAAANRAQDAIVRFPNSPMHREALEVMVEAYDRMGVPELRDDAKRVMEKSYPKSEYLSRGFRSKQDPWWKLW